MQRLTQPQQRHGCLLAGILLPAQQLTASLPSLVNGPARVGGCILAMTDIASFDMCRS